MIESIKTIIGRIAEGVWCQHVGDGSVVWHECPFCYAIKPDDHDDDCLTVLAREIKAKIEQSSRKEISIEEWQEIWKKTPKYTGDYVITNKKDT